MQPKSLRSIIQPFKYSLIYRDHGALYQGFVQVLPPQLLHAQVSVHPHSCFSKGIPKASLLPVRVPAAPSSQAARSKQGKSEESISSLSSDCSDTAASINGKVLPAFPQHFEAADHCVQSSDNLEIILRVSSEQVQIATFQSLIVTQIWEGFHKGAKGILHKFQVYKTIRTSQLNYLKGQGGGVPQLKLFPLKHPEGKKATTKYYLFFLNMTKTRFSQKELPDTKSFSKTISTFGKVIRNRKQDLST